LTTVFEYVIRLTDPLVTLLILLRRMLLDLPVKCVFNLFFRRVLGDAENFVVILIGGHET
jgi:hypothetical protein